MAANGRRFICVFLGATATLLAMSSGCLITSPPDLEKSAAGKWVGPVAVRHAGLILSVCSPMRLGPGRIAAHVRRRG
jgi:hypothetical protein